MPLRAESEYRFEKLTWPDINDVVAMQKVCILPVGAIEQHGPHLPLDMDCVAPTEIARALGKLFPRDVLVLPTVSYGYTSHVMDFPGTINIHYEHFIRQVLDVTRSLAYHGFQKIILLNGHGSNMPCLDLVVCRTNVETEAECVALSWWMLLTVDREFLPKWRESQFPGGCAHACELETAVYMYLDGDNVRHELNRSEIAIHNREGHFNWVDLFGAGVAPVITWTSTYTSSGVAGESELATAEKGGAAFGEAVKQLGDLVGFLRNRTKPLRRDRHRISPQRPTSWGERPLTSDELLGSDGQW